VRVPIVGDLLSEPSETFSVNLNSANSAGIDDSQGIGTIVDNDQMPSVSINDISVQEGRNGKTSATFTVTLSAATGSRVSVNFATANGTAIAGSDYAARTGTITFNPGVTTQTITITVNGDRTIEPNETFFVNLTAAVNAILGDAQGVCIILNDD
jgi:hypothetical protein